MSLCLEAFSVNRVRLAVVGLGRISQAHLVSVAALSEEAELAAVVSRREEVARATAERYGAKRFYLDYQEALADPEIDGVVICTPNRVHPQDSISAAEAGKHVLVEKIMANTVAEADAMIASADRSGVLLMVAQCRRFFDAVMNARESMREIGKPINIIHYLGVMFADAPTAWWKGEDMGNLVLDMNGPHVIDTILWLMGEKPVRVYAETYRNNSQWNGCDEATVQLSFESGAMATGHISFNTKPEVNERYIVGSSGGMRISNDRDLWVNGDLRVKEEPSDYLQGGSNFRRQMMEFVRAIREGHEPIASGRQVREVVRVLEAAHASAANHQAVNL